jgi:hypothetical protein
MQYVRHRQFGAIRPSTPTSTTVYVDLSTRKSADGVRFGATPHPFGARWTEINVEGETWQPLGDSS